MKVFSISLAYSKLIHLYWYDATQWVEGIGLAKKFVQVFTYDVTEKIKCTFWPTIYVGLVTWQNEF